MGIGVTEWAHGQLVMPRVFLMEEQKDVAQFMTGKMADKVQGVQGVANDGKEVQDVT